jgi:hypothetical protein
MAVTRTNRVGEFPLWVYTNDAITGNLAATDIDDGDTIPAGLYFAVANVRLNANVSTSTITAITVGGVNLVFANASDASLDGAQAIGTQYTTGGLIHLVSAGAQVSTTTSASPQYDLTIMLMRLADHLA